jgi:hypothetical protein
MIAERLSLGRVPRTKGLGLHGNSVNGLNHLLSGNNWGQPCAPQKDGLSWRHSAVIGRATQTNGPANGDAALAQLVEHIIRNDGVTCSSHVSGTSLSTREIPNIQRKGFSQGNFLGSGLGRFGKEKLANPLQPHENYPMFIDVLP